MSTPPRLGDAWRHASRRIDRLDARLLLESVGACNYSDLIAHPERELTSDQATAFAALVARREAGEPLAYLLGTAWFADLEFRVTPDVLIPRPETELLVDLAVERAQWHTAPRIVDLGTGSGIIPILLAKRCPRADVTAVDISPAALTVAQENAVRHGVSVRFLRGSWYQPLGDERVDLIVSNPPYVAEGDAHLIQNGLPFEPQGALTDGVVGGDGTACLRAIVAGAAAHLSPGGWLLMEHGYDQVVQVRSMLLDAGFWNVNSWRDEAGIERVSGGSIA